MCVVILQKIYFHKTYQNAEISTSTNLGPKIEPIKSIKSPVSGCIILMAETKMPFPYSMGCVSCLLEELGHNVYIGWETGRHPWFDIHVLTTYSKTKLSPSFDFWLQTCKDISLS